MKKLFFSLLALPLVLTGCSSSDDDNASAAAQVTYEKKTFNVAKEGEDIKVALHNAVAVPVLDFLGDTGDWIELSQSAGGSYLNDRYYYFNVAANESYESDRTGRIVFTVGTQKDTITVYQTGGHPVIFMGSDTLRVSAVGGIAEAVVNSNFDFNCLMPAETWVRAAQLPQSTRGVVKEHVVFFELDPNNSTVDRMAKVVYSDPQTSLKDTLVILQGGQIVMGDHRYTLDPEAATLSLTMNSEAAVTATSEAEWVKADAKGKVLVEALPADSVEREAVVTFQNKANGVKEEVTIYQRRPVIVRNPNGDIVHSVGLIAQHNYQLSAATINGDTENLVWASNNEAVATVSETGLVTPVANGTALITVTAADGTKAVFSVEVKDAKEFMDFFFSGTYTLNGDKHENTVSCSMINHSVYQIRVTKVVLNEGQKGALTRTLNQNVAVGDTATASGMVEELHPAFKWTFTISGKTYNITITESDNVIQKNLRRKE